MIYYGLPYVLIINMIHKQSKWSKYVLKNKYWNIFIRLYTGKFNKNTDSYKSNLQNLICYEKLIVRYSFMSNVTKNIK